MNTFRWSNEELIARFGTRKFKLINLESDSAEDAEMASKYYLGEGFEVVESCPLPEGGWFVKLVKPWSHHCFRFDNTQPRK